MSISNQLSSALTRLIGYSSSTPHCATLSGPDGVTIEIDLTAVDSMSCSASEVRLLVPALVDADFDVLKKWASELCARVTYLLENIGPLEFSPDSREVLIRSTPPDQRSVATQFYEVILQSHNQGNFSLKRYRSEKGTPGREPVDIESTHQVLHKLVNDLIETIPDV